MRLKLRIWRQRDSKTAGKLVDYALEDLTPDMSLLEVLDLLNERLVLAGEQPVAFDHDCREGICGTCGFMINGRAHGPLPGVTTCQLHLRSFEDGACLLIEPFRAAAFPIKRDLRVDRSALDRIVGAGGFVSVSTGQAPEANGLPIAFEAAEAAFDAAACIGCGACVASCKNGSAALFTGAKVAHLARLPQGKVEAPHRVRRLVAQMDAEGFGHCSNTGACEAECPQQISVGTIAQMNWEYLKAKLRATRS